jgi:methionyl aminopeptidase
MIQGLANYKKAGKIAKEVVEYAKNIIKPNILLLEIAEKIESKIQQLGGKPAFPCNLSINDVAAHSTPSSQDTTKASGLLKIDIGIHVQGFIVDTAFSLDLENSEENKKIILASEKALENACKIIKPNIELWKIGNVIQETILGFQLSPIRNLSGHQLAEYKVHAGLTIPNTNNNNSTKLPQGVFAIEPFATSGQGLVYDGKPSGIYILEGKKAVRNPDARKILEFIEEEYSTLPFCERWIEKKFPHASFSLLLLEQAGILHQYSQLVEKSHGKVSQAETTILVTDKIEVLV